MSFFAELKRRNVFRVAAAYIIVGWLLLQISDTLVPALYLPEWFHSGVAFVLILGFPVAVIFAWAFELTPQGIRREHEVVSNESITRSTGRKLDFAIIGLLVMALGYFVWESRYKVTEDMSGTTITADSTEKSIAVLPFVNMSNDPEQEYFSDGISEELLNVLAQYPGLLVAARTSSFQFKGQSPDIADVAEKLHVTHVLAGSVRKSGTRLRITARLVETNSGFQLWSETFDRELDEIFAIQDEISAAIGEALKVQLKLDDGGGARVPTVPQAASAAAYGAYMRGRQLINLRGRNNLQEAVTHLEKALKLDNNYAPAHAQMAIAIGLLSNGAGAYGDLTSEEVTARATPHITRALELDNQLPETFAAQALLALNSADYDMAIENASRALKLNPSYTDALNWLNLGYVRSGMYSKYEDTLAHLLRVDPLSIIGRYNLAFVQTLQGDVSAAHALADSISAQSPQMGFFTRGVVAYAGSGDLAESLNWFLRASAVDQDSSNTIRYMSLIYGHLDMFPEAQRLREDLQPWALLGLRRWPELIADYRQKLANDPSALTLNIYLADALHLSGDLVQAQLLYEDIISKNPNTVIFNPALPSVAPTARAALGRLRAGDEAGGEDLVELVTENQRQRRLAGWQSGRYFRTDAILAAIDGNIPMALENIEQAISKGLRDRGIFSEPAFDSFNESPEFLTLRSQLDSIINAEHDKTLQMICINSPVPDAWQPLPETCEGVEATP